MRKRPDYHRLYKTKKWKDLRRQHLALHPYCQCPKHEGQYVEGWVVDHITPHRGDKKLFYDRNNLQTLTKYCHDSWKQAQERSPHKGCDEHGWPSDPDHPWNQEKVE